MRKLGIIGGLAWPSTLDYYRLLCEKAATRFAHQGALPPYPTPPMVIESLNITETRALRGEPGCESSWAAYDAMFRDSFRRLQGSGADFGLIACNTPHVRFESITRGLDLPVISILETTARAVRASRDSRALILGTPLTMRSTAYADVLRSFGIQPLALPDEHVVAALDRLIDEDLSRGEIGGAGAHILDLCREAIPGAEDVSVCLACTELPRAFPEHQDKVRFRIGGFSFVNTTVAHVEAALAKSFGE